MSEETRAINVLSIDAWRYDTGWTWNMWHKVGTIDSAALAVLSRHDVPERVRNRRLIGWARREGYLGSKSQGLIAVEDDGYNIVFAARGTREPLFAIEYGASD
jgi:hypothetical protein